MERSTICFDVQTRIKILNCRKITPKNFRVWALFHISTIVFYNNYFTLSTHLKILYKSFRHFCVGNFYFLSFLLFCFICYLFHSHKLTGVKIVIKSFLFHQFFMITLLYYITLIHNQNYIGVLYR